MFTSCAGKPTRRTALGALLAVPLSRYAFAQAAAPIGDVQLRDVLRGRLEIFPGSGVIAGVRQNDRSHAVAVAAGAAAPTEDSVFQIGALTKTFTATILAEMVARGEVRLTDTIDEYLPKGVSTPTYEGRKITLVDLATQTSGLPQSIANLNANGNPYEGFTEAQLFDFLGYFQLKRAIGSQYETSNLGVGLLGYLLARRDGSDYDTLLRRRVLDPIDMTSTGTVLTPRLRAKLEPGHTFDGAPGPLWNYGVLAGGGGAYSTLRDMMRFLEANTSRSSGPLGDACAMAQQPRKKTPIGDIGLVWNIEENDATLWQNGITGGYHAFIGLSKDRTLGSVLLANAAQVGIDEIGFRMLDPTLWPMAPFPPVVQVPSSTLRRYTGRYAILDGHLTIKQAEDGSLIAQIMDEHPMRIYPSSPTEFFYKAVDAQLSFQIGRSGKVMGLILYQRGETYQGDRISPQVH